MTRPHPAGRVAIPRSVLLPLVLAATVVLAGAASERDRSSSGRAPGEDGTADPAALYAEGRRWLESGTPADALRALPWLERALRTYGVAAVDTAATAGEAECLYALAVAHGITGELETATDYGERSIAAFAAREDPRGLASAHDHLGGLLVITGETGSARHHLEEALRLRRRTGDLAAVAASLHNLASLRFEVGEAGAALELAAEALALHRQLGDRAAIAAGTSNLGLMWTYLGRYGPGRRYLEEALHLHRRLGDPRGQARVSSNLGLLAWKVGDGARASERLGQALELYRRLGDPRGRAEALGNLGWVALESGRLDSARERLEAALALARDHELRRVEGAHTGSLGRLLTREGRWQEAEAALLRAAEMQASAADPWGRSTTLLELARVHAHQGSHQRALGAVDEALGLVERTRSGLGIGGSPGRDLPTGDLRAHFLASRRQLYDFRIELLMALGRPEAALLTAERARARSLLDILRLARSTDAGAGVGTAGLVDAHGGVSARSPDPPSTLAEIRALLDDETLVVAYHLGHERAWAWTLDASSGPRGFALGSTDRLEALAEDAYGHLARSRHRAHRGPAEVASRRLAEVVLSPLGPGGADSTGDRGAEPRRPGRRLAFVPDGALHRIPFAALPFVPPPADRARALVEAKEVVLLPSLAVLAELRGRVGSGNPPPGELAILADPVFSTDDPRLQLDLPSRAGAGPEGNAKDAPGKADTDASVGRAGNVVLTAPLLDFTRPDPAVDAAAGVGEASAPRWGAGSDLPLPLWGRLPYSGVEAERLAGSFPADRVRVATGFAATRDLLLGGELAGYRRLHLATHARIDDVHPERSGLFLSGFDAEGRPREALVRLGDLFRLRLGAELVTLSACRSALGPRLGGEGLLGLSRGFFHAGARGLVVSLWDVDDRATAELMDHFYGSLAEGLAPAAALARAQRHLRRDLRWQAPFYWAPFVVLGDWR